MSSSPTAPTSTTRSSSNCSSPRTGSGNAAGARAVAVIACGALAGSVREIAFRRGWQLQVRALPAGLHNRPDQIAPAAEQLALQLQADGLRVVLGYADCGSYGALDTLCERLGLARLAGLHCYDVLGGADRVAALLAREPGTYLLTDYLVRSFDRTVVASLGLDRHPELWPDYFGHYRRLAWLAQEPDPELERQARVIAARFGLPLLVVSVGTGGLEHELELLVEGGTGGTGGTGGGEETAV
jgi:Protein of unknown function (DUF1638)